MERNYETLLDVIKVLRQQGFYQDFYLNDQGLYCPTLGKQFYPEEITDYYRFEGMSYPGDNDILYTVKTNEGEKGILVCPYGAYAESFNLLPQLKIEREFR